MQDRWEKTWEKESEGKDQVATSQRVAGGKPGSAGELPPGLLAKLPKFAEKDVTSNKPSNPVPEVSSQGKKHPLDADDEIVEVDHDEVTGPPKKMKKKKNKVKIGRKMKPLCRRPRMTGHAETAQRPNPRLRLGNLLWSPPPLKLWRRGTRLQRKRKRRRAPSSRSSNYSRGKLKRRK